jgi:hypothetical protein
MPFPPTFTNVWDITQPPDTQLANLLGQDIRNLKNDIMQRVSLLSGTIANRPTPETVNATWGGTGYGLLYFSTDTSQIFQWNGSGWTDITSNFFSSASSIRRFTDTTSYQYTSAGTQTTTGITIPANTLQVGSKVVVNVYGDSVNSQSLAVIAQNGVPQNTICQTNTGNAGFFVDIEAFYRGTGSKGGWQLVYANATPLFASVDMNAVIPGPVSNPINIFTKYVLSGSPFVNQYALCVIVFA